MPADSLELVRWMLKDRTSAGSRVSNDLPKGAVFPYVTFERTGGGRSEEDVRRVEPRMQVNAWGKTRAEAYSLSGEIEAVFLPITNVVKGFHGEVVVGSTSVYVWDVVQEVGPTWLPDPDTGLPRYFTYYVLKHF